MAAPITTGAPVSSIEAGLPAAGRTGLGRRLGRGWRRLTAKAKFGAIVCLLFLLAAVIGPYVAPYDPSLQTSATLAAPSFHHLLGTTSFGQDVLSQLLVGIRATLEIGLLAGLIATVLSVVVGISAGYLGGWGDEGLSLLSNVFLVLPALPLLVVLLAYLPQKGDVATVLVLGLLGWPWGARVIRAQTLSIRSRDFVAAARETGDSAWRLIFFEILPNEVSLIAASFVSTVIYAVGTSVALAFLGVADLNQWTLGTMLYWAESESALQANAWWWFVPPGVAVALLAAALVLLNFGIDELGNPRLRDAIRHRRIGRQRWRPSDPTPVVRSGPSGAGRGRLGDFVHSFARSSVLDQHEPTPVETREAGA